ncbi:MAG: type 1 glutamine amidotransferase [Proteobacteria bacterium]|nr:type 1 glutamine amidotransferase [Pseudomonadota bacterium]
MPIQHAAPKILIAEGNTLERSQAMRAAGGETNAERYVNEIRRMFPKARIETVLPADGDGYLPAGMGLADFDGLVFSGSGLHIYAAEPAVTRQIDLMRSALDAGMSVLGSCWGLQVAAAATGGTVIKSPRGREVGIARKLCLTAAGRAHDLYADKSDVFDSPCVHYDEVTHLPAGSVVLAANTHSAIQAATIRRGAGSFWGVQYHPEFDLHHLARIYKRYGADMVSQGFFQDMDALDRHAGLLDALHQDPERKDIAWQLGIDADVLDADIRCREIRNWIERAVLAI